MHLQVNFIHYLILNLDLGVKVKQVVAQYHIIRQMHLQSLKLLCRTVEEEMHLQENRVFDL